MTISRRGFLELSGSGALASVLGVSACGVDGMGGEGGVGGDGEMNRQGTAPVIDASVPLASPDRGGEAVGAHLAAVAAAGMTRAFVPVATVEHFDTALRNLLAVHAMAAGVGGGDQADPAWTLVRTPSELSALVTERVPRDARAGVGVVPTFQGLQMVEQDIALIRGFKELGVGVMAITHNWKNWNGDGCLERTDLPLTGLGRLAVREMNAAGVLVDLSRAGVRTSLTAIDESQGAVVFTHSNARTVHDHPGNLTDEQIDACAARGGVIGLSAFPALVADRPEPVLNDFLAHFDYLLDRVGPDHIGLGLDFDDRPRKRYAFDPLPDPPYTLLRGLSGHADLDNVREALEDRGLGASESVQVMGGSFARVLREAWGG